jgi:hypothetical protein
MNTSDTVLIEAMAVLDPTGAQIVRMRRIIESTSERLRRPLWIEWVDLFRRQPLRSPGLVLAGACVLFLVTPLGAVVSMLLLAVRS